MLSFVRFKSHTNYPDRFSQNNQISNLKEIRAVKAEVFLADGRTDMTKLITVFRNFAKAPKIQNRIHTVRVLNIIYESTIPQYIYPRCIINVILLTTSGFSFHTKLLYTFLISPKPATCHAHLLILYIRSIKECSNIHGSTTCKMFLHSKTQVIRCQSKHTSVGRYCC